MNYRELIESHPELFDNENALFEIITDAEVITAWVEEKKKDLTRRGLPEKWGDIGVVFEGPYIIVIRDLVKFPSGRLGSYFRIINYADLKGGQASAILPVMSGKVLLMKQFRHPTRKWHWEVPRGFGEPNTTPEENAKKELLEEINGKVEELIDIGPYNSNTGIEGVKVQLFYGKLKSLGDINRDEGIVSCKLVPVKQIEAMIRNAEITDGFTIAAFTRAKLRGLI
jgi:ADP-ribose pyrophosphatase